MTAPVPRWPELPDAVASGAARATSVSRYLRGLSAPRLTPAEQTQAAVAVRYARELADQLERGAVAYRYRTRARQIVAAAKDWEETLALSLQPALRAWVKRHPRGVDPEIRDELTQACWTAAVTGIRTFDPRRGSLLGWCHLQLRGTVSDERGAVHGDRLSPIDQRVVGIAVRLKAERQLHGDALQDAVEQELADELRDSLTERGKRADDEAVAAVMSKRGYTRAIRDLNRDLLAAAKSRPTCLDSPVAASDEGDLTLHETVAARQPDVETVAAGDVAAKVEKLAFAGEEDGLRDVLIERVAAGTDASGVASTRRLASETGYTERELNAGLARAQRRVSSPVHQYCFLADVIDTVFVDADGPSAGRREDPLAAWTS